MKEMKKIFIIPLFFIFALGCSSLKISGEFIMNDKTTFKFENAKIKIDNKHAIIKTKQGETKIDMKKVDLLKIDVE